MKTKFVLFFIALLSLTCTAIAGVPHDEPTSKITVTPIIVHRGDTTNIVVSLTNPEEKYNGFQMDLILPEGFSLCSSRRSGYLYELSERFGVLQPSVVIKKQDDGRYRILVFSFNQVPIKGNSGTIITLPIVINAKMKKGKYHGTMTNIIFNKEDNKGKSIEDVVFVIKVKK